MKTLKIKLLLILILVNSLINTYAQNTQILRGTVFDIDTKTPLVGASVVIEGTPQIGTISDQNGYFRIENVLTGRHTVYIRYLGYKDKTYSNIVIHSGKEFILEAGLEESVILVQDVVVNGLRKSEASNDMTTISARQFTVEETGRYAGSRNDVSRMASNYAGVTNGDDSRNDIIIRGNSPNGLLWRLNGLDIPDPNHFSGMGSNGGPVSMLNYNVLTNSDFLTAAFPAEYGNAMSGVFDIEMRKGNTEKREYMAQIGALGTEFMVEGPFKEKYYGSYLLNYRFSTTSILSAMGIDFGYDGEADYQDLSYNIYLPVSKKSKLSLFGLWGNSVYKIKAEDRSEDSFDPTGSNTNGKYITSVYASGLSFFHPFNSNTYIKSTIGLSAETESGTIDSVSTTNANEIPYFRSENSTYNYTWHTFLQHRINARNKFKIGILIKDISYEIDEKNYSYETLNLKELRTSKGSSRLVQSYVQWKYIPSDHFRIVSGIHAQKLFLNNTAIIEPRFGAQWLVHPKHSINAGIGMHSQMQTLQTYFINTPGNELLVHSNKDLDFSKSVHYVLGYKTTLFKNTHLKLETYYQDLYNIPIHEGKKSSFSLINEGSEYLVHEEDSLTNKGVGRNYGIELSLERFFSNTYYFLITSSIYQSEYKGSDNVWRNTVFNGSYVFNVLAGKEFNLKKNRKIIIDVKVTTAGGRRYTPIDYERTMQAKELITRDDQAYTLQYKPYFRSDIKLTYRVNRKKTAHEIFLNIDNVFNNKNVFTQAFNSRTMQVEEIYQLGLFPTFQYKLYF